MRALLICGASTSIAIKNGNDFTFNDVYMVGGNTIKEIVIDGKSQIINPDGYNGRIYYEKPRNRIIQHVSIEGKLNSIILVDGDGNNYQITQFVVVDYRHS